MSNTASGWRRFWEGDHWIYVNERHRRAHCRQIADDVIGLLPPDRALRVLDYGCGDALDAQRVAARCTELLLYDASEAVRRRLTARFEDAAGIRVVDDAALAALPEGSVDMIVVVSVVQYLGRDELRALLARWRGWLAADGVLVLADVIPPQAGLVDDVSALLRTALREGFLLAALGGLALTFFSDYRRLRHDIGLATYGEEEMLAVLAEAGYAPRRQARNLGFNPARMTFLAARAG